MSRMLNLETQDTIGSNNWLNYSTLKFVDQSLKQNTTADVFSDPIGEKFIVY